LRDASFEAIFRSIYVEPIEWILRHGEYPTHARQADCRD
jgi:hypothetical protein